MSKLLPYPGRHESFSSWDFRCRQWENRRTERNLEQAARHTNWGGYNYRAVRGAGQAKLSNGEILKWLKCFPSRSKKERAAKFAEANGCFLVKKQIGHPNVITSREDFYVVKFCDLVALPKNWEVLRLPFYQEWERRFEGADGSMATREEIYSNDDH